MNFFQAVWAFLSKQTVRPMCVGFKNLKSRSDEEDKEKNSRLLLGPFSRLRFLRCFVRCFVVKSLLPQSIPIKQTVPLLCETVKIAAVADRATVCQRKSFRADDDFSGKKTLV